MQFAKILNQSSKGNLLAINNLYKAPLIRPEVGSRRWFGLNVMFNRLGLFLCLKVVLRGREMECKSAINDYLVEAGSNGRRGE